jgi:hypothetical protein
MTTILLVVLAAVFSGLGVSAVWMVRAARREDQSYDDGREHAWWETTGHGPPASSTEPVHYTLAWGPVPGPLAALTAPRSSESTELAPQLADIPPPGSGPSWAESTLIQKFNLDAAELARLHQLRATAGSTDASP